MRDGSPRSTAVAPSDWRRTGREPNARDMGLENTGVQIGRRGLLGPADRDQGAVARTLEKLTSYTSEHFKEEEDYMAKINYPKREDHIKAHNDFMTRLSELKADAAGTQTNGMELMGLLGNWWQHHLKEDDADLAAFVRKSKAA
mgnify:CR=1 FL=1